VPAIFRHAVLVGPDSIDALEHVNNREFLRWMEAAAVLHSDANGWTTERYLASGAAWVAARHAIDYLRPAFEGDRLSVWTWIESIEARTCGRRYMVTRDADGKALAIGRSVWAFVDLASHRGVPVPAQVAAAFEPVAAEDERLEVLGAARRLLRRAG